MIDMKTCSKCGTFKPLSEFGKRWKGRGGLKAQCYECLREVARIRQAKRRAEKALWHRRAQGLPDYTDNIPRRRCPRCKENKPWNEYPKVTQKNQGKNFMCNECREKADETRRRKAKAKFKKKRLAVRYRAKMRTDAKLWRVHMKSKGKIFVGSVSEDARLWREYQKYNLLPCTP